MTRTTIILTVALSLSAVTPAQYVDAGSDTCTPWHGTHRPPAYLRVFRIHRRGSSVPAHIDRVPFRLYVERVMASGAWPARLPYASLQVGAIAIRQYAAWHIAHHQRGYSWHGRCYDIRDGDQLYRPPVELHHRIRDAVASTWGIWLRKGGRLFRTGWRGNAGRDGWHLYEDTTSSLARHGWGWLAIIRQQLSPVKIGY